MRGRALLKTAVRQVTRKLGYDLVPFAAGLAVSQRKELMHVTSVLDVGANVGQFAVRLRDLGYGGSIVSFEPSREAFAVLERKAAKASQWEARNMALGDAPGIARLNVSANSVSSSLLDVADVHLRAVPKSVVVATEHVDLSTLDMQMGDSEAVFYLKLDVQGFELPVMKGADNVLAKTRAVQFEVSFDSLYEHQSQWLDICAFLQDRNLRVRYFEPGYETRDGQMLQADVLMTRVVASR